MTREHKWFGIACLLLAVSPLAAQQPHPAPLALPVGTMVATRNLESDDPAVDNNPSPGHWNHLAMVGPGGWVFEAQYGRGVIAVPWATFFNRYPELVAFVPDQYPQAAGLKVALAAASRLGEPYRKLGGNCVVLQRSAVEHVMHQRPRWRRPDDAVPSQVPHGRGKGTVLWMLKRPPGWVPIADFFQGTTNNPSDVLRVVQ